ncbi:MAG TPA: HU family DNA-binding protein [bacterium]|jgi:DNA-binding protein HU-beta|nr:HU family DNA-binding protein [bacterium]HOG38391.1 HU family DNA-binding protein [bacterium]HQI03349.1 HU family DNA-binding protein [bacterium]
MNKIKLIEVIASKTKLNKKEIAKVLDIFEETIIHELQKGDKVTLTSFGTFETITTKQRYGVNPRNIQERIIIPSIKLPKFRAGKRFKDEIRK